MKLRREVLNKYEANIRFACGKIKPERRDDVEAENSGEGALVPFEKMNMGFRCFGEAALSAAASFRLTLYDTRDGTNIV
ncbi:MAG: hypothetical protein AAFP77_31475 [Bacteroidota bacterium]